MKTQALLRKVVPATSALLKLEECIVLMFRYEQTEDRFVLVADYPERAAGGDRAFVALGFGGVSEFDREYGDLARCREFGEYYQASEDAPPLVVQDVQAVGSSEGGRVQYWFGPGFGGVRFEYENLDAVVRDSRAWEEANVFHYADLTSGEEFNFFRAFPGCLWRHEVDV